MAVRLPVYIMVTRNNSDYGYGKIPLWQWIIIYLIVGGVIYGLVYYFIFAKKSGYSTVPQETNQTQSPPHSNQDSSADGY